jgi:two-component system, cell cycle response regulator
MREMIKKRLDELKMTGALPSPTGVGLSILQLTRGDDYAMGEITQVISGDPALTGRIIKLANSAAHTGADPARNVGEAAMRLGVRAVRNLALSFTLVNGNRSGACRGFDYDTYWSHSLATAVSAQCLAARVKLVVPAEAFTCGLLSGIGRLALASIHPDRYAAVLSRARSDGHELIACEREAFDLDHRELAAALLEDWQLPAHFSFAVSSFETNDGLRDSPDEACTHMTLILQVAARLVRDQIFSEESKRRIEVMPLVQSLGLTNDDLQELCVELRSKWTEWGHILQIPTDTAARDLESAAQRLATDTSPVVADPLVQNVPRRKGLRILVVDDDPVSLRLITHHLTRDGHEVFTAPNGKDALVRVLQDNPQMVVTDWMMPEMDGIELCKALRRTTEGRGIYTLLLTGREDEDRVVEAFDSGADDYVNKPFNPKILLARVRAGQRMIELREQVEADRRERARQVSQMAVLNRRLEAAAMTDILTRLPNRRYAMARLEQEVANARRIKSPLCVIMLDIDHFKAVNDAYGHDIGDYVLKETAEALRRAIRKNDVPCRLGGEEFLVICPNSDLQGAALVSERVRAAVSELDFGANFKQTVTASLGVAAFDTVTSTVDTLIKEADKRVYVAKARGRNQVAVDGETGPDSLPGTKRSA